MTGPERLRPGLYPVEQAIRVEPLEPALPETVLAEAAELLPPEPRRRRSRAGRWFLGSVAAFLVAAVSVQAGFFVADMYQRSLLLGAAMSALLGLAGASGLWWILAELRELRRLETVERVRDVIAALDDAGMVRRHNTHWVMYIPAGMATQPPRAATMKPAKTVSRVNLESLCTGETSPWQPSGMAGYDVVIRQG